VQADLSPFFPFGATGLFQAMGYTFITLQGADLIAAVAGEVRDPGRTIPRAMFLSLGIALAIYLPLLFLMATVGVAPGGSIAEMSARNPETIVALAVKNYMGTFGFWLVVVAAILSMLSALQMNLFAASRIAHAMALDRTLPVFLGRLHDRYKTPIASILASLLTILLILLVISDVAVAASSSFCPIPLPTEPLRSLDTAWPAAMPASGHPGSPWSLRWAGSPASRWPSFKALPSHPPHCWWAHGSAWEESSSSPCSHDGPGCSMHLPRPGTLSSSSSGAGIHWFWFRSQTRPMHAPWWRLQACWRLRLWGVSFC
jgi:hypothetical protein